MLGKLIEADTYYDGMIDASNDMPDHKYIAKSDLKDNQTKNFSHGIANKFLCEFVPHCADVSTQMLKHLAFFRKIQFTLKIFARQNYYFIFAHNFLIADFTCDHHTFAVYLRSYILLGALIMTSAPSYL